MWKGKQCMGKVALDEMFRIYANDKVSIRVSICVIDMVKR